MRKKAKDWTDEETELARALMERGASDEEFLEKLGRSRSASYYRLRYVDLPAVRGSASSKYRSNEPGPRGAYKNRDIPAEMARDAEQRLIAKRTLTQAFFGDPPAGHSALDKKRAGVVP